MIRTENTVVNEVNIQAWINAFKNKLHIEREELYKQYRGKSSIDKLKTELDKVCGKTLNSIHSNYARMIVNNAKSYLVGKPVTYAFNKPEIETKVKALNYRNNEKALNNTLAKNQSIYGIAYEMMGIDEKKEVYIKALDPKNTFFVYDMSVLDNVVCAITFWNYKDATSGKDLTTGYAFTSDEIIQFKQEASSIYSLDHQINPFKPCLPVYEFKNNDDMLGDYESVTELLDAYNKLISINFDDVDGVANAILALYNARLTKDDEGKVKRTAIMEFSGENPKAEYIYKQLDKSYVEWLRESIRSDIFTITNIPDFTDEKFAGNSSGVALSYKLIGFDNLHADKAEYFEEGIKSRITCLLNYKNLSNTLIEIEEGDVEMVFHKNLPKNIERDKEIVEMAQTGIISKETAFDNMELIKDSAEELERIAAERPQIEVADELEI